MAYLQKYFEDEYPLQNRRLFYYRQANGQLMSEFSLKLKCLWEQADIHKIDPEELLVFRLLTGCTDQKVRNELLKVKEPTVAKLNAKINQWERERKQEKRIQASLDPNQKVNAVALKKNYKSKGNYNKGGNQGRGGGGPNPHQLNDKLRKLKEKGCCFRCGRTGHKSDAY